RNLCAQYVARGRLIFECRTSHDQHTPLQQFQLRTDTHAIAFESKHRAADAHIDAAVDNHALASRDEYAYTSATPKYPTTEHTASFHHTPTVRQPSEHIVSSVGQSTEHILSSLAPAQRLYSSALPCTDRGNTHLCATAYYTPARDRVSRTCGGLQRE